MSLTIEQEVPTIGLSRGLGIGLFRVPGESFCTFNNGMHFMQKQKVATDKMEGYREGEGWEHFTGNSIRKGPVSQTS